MIRRPVLCGAILSATLLVAAHPIIDGGATLHWASHQRPVSYVIQAEGSEDVSPAAAAAAIRLAFEAWQEVDGSEIAFVEDTRVDRSRTDYGANDMHLVMFDENNSTGLFPGMSAVVALTPTTFDTVTGRIIDADIIFNGKDHTFSVDGRVGTHDIQAIATHEIGHLLGLDHSATLAATMYPFVTTGTTTCRCLALDDALGAGGLYPDGPPGAALRGRIRHSGTLAAVRGAHVVAVDANGVVTLGTYTDNAGDFELSPLPDGDYTVYAEPLDGPVAGANLASSIGSLADTTFRTQFYGGNPTPLAIGVTSGDSFNLGTLDVQPPGAFRVTDASNTPLLAPTGGFAAFTVYGTGLDGADETLSVSGAGVSVFWSQFTAGAEPRHDMILQITAGAAHGPRNLQVSSAGGEIAILTGAIQVGPPAPLLSSVSPVVAASQGATTLTIVGQRFVGGARVFIEGIPADGVSVDSATQITCLVPTSESGTADLVVQNPDGQLARLLAALTLEGDPQIDSVFPTAGASVGGTTLIIDGEGFEDAVQVTLGGQVVSLTSVTWTRIIGTTPAGALGTVDLEIANPAGLSAELEDAFTYVEDLDPQILSVTPDRGSTAGGTEVEIIGEHLDMGLSVWFGNQQATSVVRTGSTRVLALTPARTAGVVDVWVENPGGTGAAALAAFTFQASTPRGGGGGGGGGCLSVPPLLPGASGSGGAPGAGGAASIAGSLMPYGVMLAAFLLLRRSRRDGQVPAIG